jgi:hypothetical protein
MSNKNTQAINQADSAAASMLESDDHSHKKEGHVEIECDLKVDDIYTILYTEVLKPSA